jgi:hypothetical protein
VIKVRELLLITFIIIDYFPIAIGIGCIAIINPISRFEMEEKFFYHIHLTPAFSENNFIYG